MIDFFQILRFNEIYLWQAGAPAIIDAEQANIFDLYLPKYWAIKFSTAAACTILKVDQVRK